MQSVTVFVLACLVAVAVAHTHYEQLPADAASAYDALNDMADIPEQDVAARNKRSLLLKKKFLLGSLLGLKAVKIAGLGAGAAAVALKSKKPSVTKEIIIPHHHQNHYGYSSHGPSWNVDVHSWH